MFGSDWRVYRKHQGVESLEPAGGFERPVCRIRCDRSDIELHRLMFKGIQLGARVHQKRDNAVGQESEKTAIELQSDADCTFRGQGHVIARHQYFLKPISNLEFT